MLVHLQQVAVSLVQAYITNKFFFSLQGRIETKCIHLAKHFAILLSNIV